MSIFVMANLFLAIASSTATVGQFCQQAWKVNSLEILRRSLQDDAELCIKSKDDRKTFKELTKLLDLGQRIWPYVRIVMIEQIIISFIGLAIVVCLILVDMENTAILGMNRFDYIDMPMMCLYIFPSVVFWYRTKLSHECAFIGNLNAVMKVIYHYWIRASIMEYNSKCDKDELVQLMKQTIKNELEENKKIFVEGIKKFVDSREPRP